MVLNNSFMQDCQNLQFGKKKKKKKKNMQFCKAQKVNHNKLRVALYWASLMAQQ